MSGRETVRCPSARCAPGAVLLGVVGADGRVAFLPPGYMVDEAFARIARQGRNPESRFRFGGRCVEGACAQWSGDRCTVLDQVRAEEPALALAAGAAPARCAIREHCRWHRQDGDAACAVCPLVITDLLPPE
jgi:hypothetical protein